MKVNHTAIKLRMFLKSNSNAKVTLHIALAVPKLNRKCLTLSVPVSYQQPSSPYVTHTKYDI